MQKFGGVNKMFDAYGRCEIGEYINNFIWLWNCTH